ncbi:MAG: hypothetical protein ACYDA6_02870 [Solirubrobacteraceae bacterium]
MERLVRAGPSPAMVVAMTALVISLSGTTIAAVDGPSHAGNAAKAKHKKKKQASDSPTDQKQILADAPKLSVKFAAEAGSASTAASASNATNATSATNATNAASAGNATNLGGQPASAYLLSGTSGEAWHLVGAAGQPSFEHSWTNLGAGYAPAAFYLDPVGRVHFKGVLTGGTKDATAFTLPAAYRPPENLAFAVAAGGSPPTVEDVDVYSTGEVFLNGEATSAVALDGISFRVH